MSGSNIAGIAVPDPDLFHPDPYIRRGVGGGSRPLYKERGGGGLVSQKIVLFWPFGPQFGLQIEKFMCKM